MSRRSFLAGLLVMTSAATMVAGGELSEQSITGRVVDAQTNQPVSDVNVWIPESMIVTKTDAWGEFVLREVPDSAFVLELRILGYESVKVSSLVPGMETSNLEIRLHSVYESMHRRGEITTIDQLLTQIAIVVTSTTKEVFIRSSYAGEVSYILDCHGNTE